VAISTITPYRSFYMNESSTDLFLDQLYQRIEDVVDRFFLIPFFIIICFV